VAKADPELDRLMAVERAAFDRYQRLKGFPGDVPEIALALWTEATAAVGEYRAKPKP
jgi:hypothetical protein